VTGSVSRPALQPIGAVAGQLGIAAHVLRFWETRFPAIVPLKRAGGRRYYREVDVALLRAIARLSRDRGLTLSGIERLIAERGVAAVAGEFGGGQGAVTTPASIHDVRDRLQAALARFRAAAGAMPSS